MVRMTTIVRHSDGMVLCASMEEGNDTEQMSQYKSKTRAILKKAREPDSAPRFFIEDPPFYFLYIIEKGVVYMTLCEKNYPKKLAVSFLEELSQEFDQMYGRDVAAAQRPYEFIKFDTFIQKTKKLFLDTRSDRNLVKVSEELAEVHAIFSKSINEIMNRGEKLNSVSAKSGTLMEETFKYREQAKDYRRSMMWRKYAPFIALVVIILLFFVFRYVY